MLHAFTTVADHIHRVCIQSRLYGEFGSESRSTVSVDYGVLLKILQYKIFLFS